MHLLGEDGVWVVGDGVVLELLSVEEHLESAPFRATGPEGGASRFGYLHRCSLHNVP
jgi:hypothetical protein